MHHNLELYASSVGSSSLITALSYQTSGPGLCSILCGPYLSGYLPVLHCYRTCVDCHCHGAVSFFSHWYKLNSLLLKFTSWSSRRAHFGAMVALARQLEFHSSNEDALSFPGKTPKRPGFSPAKSEKGGTPRKEAPTPMKVKPEKSPKATPELDKRSSKPKKSPMKVKKSPMKVKTTTRKSPMKSQKQKKQDLGKTPSPNRRSEVIPATQPSPVSIARSVKGPGPSAMKSLPKGSAMKASPSPRVQTPKSSAMKSSPGSQALALVLRLLSPQPWRRPTIERKTWRRKLGVGRVQKKEKQVQARRAPWRRLGRQEVRLAHLLGGDRQQELRNWSSLTWWSQPGMRTVRKACAQKHQMTFGISLSSRKVSNMPMTFSQLMMLGARSTTTRTMSANWTTAQCLRLDQGSQVTQLVGAMIFSAV